MPPAYVASLLEIIGSGDLSDCGSLSASRRRYPRLVPNSEITLEANPETRDAKSFTAFREAGVNRLSMGAQSFDPQELKLLGRAHSTEGVHEAVKMAREAGFENISLDLIYGVPGQTVESFKRSVEISLGLGIEHLSAYTLSIEEGTPFARSVREKRLPPPDPDLMADQYAVLTELMRNAGFELYELTNYAKPGLWSRHNYAYWQRTPYLGVGNGAHSFDGERRFWNRRDTRAHIAAVESGGDPTEGEERLKPEEVLQEQVYLALRTRDGLSEELALLCNQDSISDLVKAGFLERRDLKFHVAEERWLMLDEVVLRLLEKR